MGKMRLPTSKDLLCDHSVASLVLPPGFTRVDGELHYGATARWMRCLTFVVGLFCTAQAYIFAETLMNREFGWNGFGEDRYYPTALCHWARQSDDQCTATAHADGFVTPFCIDELNSTQCADALAAALLVASDIESAGGVAVAELGIDGFPDPGSTLAKLCPSIIPGQCGERQPIKGEGSRICNDWGGYYEDGGWGVTPKPYEFPLTPWGPANHDSWFGDMHQDLNVVQGTSPLSAIGYPYCPAHTPPNWYEVQGRAEGSCIPMCTGSAGPGICQGGVIVCDDCPDWVGADLPPGSACSCTEMAKLAGRMAASGPQPVEGLPPVGSPIDAIKCRDMSKAHAKAINVALLNKRAAISKCLASPASCHPEPEFVLTDALAQCWDPTSLTIREGQDSCPDSSQSEQGTLIGCPEGSISTYCRTITDNEHMSSLDGEKNQYGEVCGGHGERPRIRWPPWDWGESMQAEALNQATYVITTANRNFDSENGACDCGCKQFPEAFSDDTGRVPCEDMPDCNCDLMKGPATGCRDECQYSLCSSECGDDSVCTSFGLWLTTTIVGVVVSRGIELLYGIFYFRYVFCESGVGGEAEQCCPGFLGLASSMSRRRSRKSLPPSGLESAASFRCILCG